MISGGLRDRLPDVEHAYASRGSQVLHTAECGAVSLSIAEGRLEVARFHVSTPQRIHGKPAERASGLTGKVWRNKELPERAVEI